MVLWYELQRVCRAPLLCFATCSLLGWLHSLPAVFFSTYSIFLAFPGFPLQHRPAQLLILPSEAACKDSDPITHTWPPRLSLEIWVEPSMTPVSLALCMPAKPASCRQCQGLLPAQVVAKFPWIKATATCVCVTEPTKTLL
jgi:hypothetical protein